MSEFDPKTRRFTVNLQDGKRVAFRPANLLWPDVEEFDVGDEVELQVEPQQSKGTWLPGVVVELNVCDKKGCPAYLVRCMGKDVMVPKSPPHLIRKRQGKHRISTAKL